jgi:2-dehydro-3-deoxygluconokinase
VPGALGAVGEGLAELGLEPAPDRTVTLGFGGDAANAAVMAARMGADARIAGRVGADALGRRLLAFWAASGIDVDHVLGDPSAPTGIYVNERGAEGLRRFDYHRSGSAGSNLTTGDVDPSFVDGLGVLHLTGITLAVSASSRDAALDLAERARARGVRVALAVNHRPALGGDVARLHDAARQADIVFASEDEARVVFGTADAVALAADLGAGEVVLTRGDKGATLVVSGDSCEIAAPAVTSVDPAGAGDALAGAYLSARLAGETPQQALRVGVAAAALSCRARGCALSYPSRAEVTAAVQEA